jgi:uncharacterized repeat protein (TIGR01451 family)
VVDPAPLTGVAAGDVTGDGLTDVVTASGATGSADAAVRVYRQRTGGGLDPVPALLPTGGTGHRGAVAVADLDGDGDGDVAATTDDAVLLYRQGTDGLGLARTVPLTGAWGLATGDVSGDGVADLVVKTTSGVQVLRTSEPDLRPVTLSTDPAYDLAVGDVTGDGRSDVVTAEGAVVRVYAQVSGGFASPASYPTGAPDPTEPVRGVAVGDTDGDGLADVHLSVGATAPRTWVVTRHQVAGLLGTAEVRTTAAPAGALAAADVTGDGRRDLVVGHDVPQSIDSVIGVVASTPGTAPVETAYTVPTGSGYDPGTLAVADVTGDGRPDVLAAGWLFGLVVLAGTAPGADGTAPETAVTDGPAGELRSRTATFAFTATEEATFECSLDHLQWRSCASPTTYDGLASGAHLFQVRATDRAGNVEPDPAERTFSVPDAADVAVSLEATPAAKKGSEVTWTARVRNDGPVAATGVTLVEELPAEVTSVTVTTADPAATCSTSAQTVRCLLPRLPTGATTLVTVRATATTNKGLLQTTARVGSASWDPEPGNDSASTVTKVGNGRGN